MVASYEITAVGLDLAISTFKAYGARASKRAILCGKLSRDQVLVFFDLSHLRVDDPTADAIDQYALHCRELQHGLNLKAKGSSRLTITFCKIFPWR